MERHPRHIRSITRRGALVAAALIFALARPISGVEWTQFEGTARGYPVLRDLNGRPMAEGDFAQWIAGDRLHVRISYAFPGGRRVVEDAVLRQRPQLAQESWSFRDLQGTTVSRAFAVDFRNGAATAMKRDDGGTQHWSERLDVEEGRTFAGFGFSLAIKALRERLVRGETVTLKGVGFAPKPRLASVDVSYGGRDRIRLAGRALAADRFIVHPRIPLIARMFVKVPDATIWLTTPPAGFLRWEGALAEPDDQVIRVDLLPGGVSEAAIPVATSRRK